MTIGCLVDRSDVLVMPVIQTSRSDTIILLEHILNVRCEMK